MRTAPAMAIGAATRLMDGGWWCSTIRAPDDPVPRLAIMDKSYPGNIVVTRRGRRIANESQNYITYQLEFYRRHTPQDPQVPSWMIFDARSRRMYFNGPLWPARYRPDKRLPKDYFTSGFLTRADSIRELADAGRHRSRRVWRRRCSAMNEYARTGKDLEFGRGDAEYDRYYADPRIKPNPCLAPIVEPPFYAMRIDPGDFGTHGGLVDQHRCAGAARRRRAGPRTVCGRQLRRRDPADLSGARIDPGSCHDLRLAGGQALHRRARMIADQLLDPAELRRRRHARRRGSALFDDPGHRGAARAPDACAAHRGEASTMSASTPGSARIHNTLVARLRAPATGSPSSPEILDEQLPPPIVILGLARTGTTLLHRLLQTDPRIYAAAWWEVRFPVPAADDVQGEQRIAAAKAEVAGILAAMPELASIHPWDAMGADEDIMLIDATLLEHHGRVARVHPELPRLDPLPGPAPRVRLPAAPLKFLQWQKKQRGQGAEYWSLKTPMHLGYVEVIAEQMPNAMFVQTHRDPIATMPVVRQLRAHAVGDGQRQRRSARGRAPVVADPRGTPEPLHGQRERLPNRFIDVDFRDTVGRPGAGGRAHLPGASACR